MASNKVKVIEMNAGEKIAYEQSGARLFFGDDEIMVNVEKYQKDWDVQVDICRDKSGNLTIGTESALRYVAQIAIPATTYTETPIASANVAGAAENEGGMNHDNIQRDKNPLDMGEVKLSLWSIE